jgi:hypothetical protein
LPNLQKDISIASLRLGLAIFLLIAIMLFCGGGYFSLFIALIVPGVGYGMVLAASVENPRSDLRTIFFIIVSMFINVFCVWRIYIDFMDNESYASMKVVTYSTIAAVVLSICFDRLIVGRFSLYYTIAMPALLGIAASLCSAGCMYLLMTGQYNEFISGLLWIGMFTIFPLWLYFFGLNVRSYNRAAGLMVKE